MTEVANVYGQALYELARDEGLSKELLAQLQSLKQIFAAEPAFTQLLCTPSIPKQERCQVLDSVLQNQVHPYLLNFLKILTEKGYVRQFPGCCDTYVQHYNRDNGILQVKAVTALPLSDELRRKLTDKLSSITGKTIELDCHVDAEVLGGVRLDFDGKQVDGTVRRKLEDIRGILKNTVL